MNDTLMERPFEILLVEDSLMDTLLVKRALAREGQDKNLVEMTDGEKAMAHLRGSAGGPGRPDLVLLDLNLPKMSGWEVLAECKGDPELNTIPIVVFTTVKSDTEIQSCYELGADSVVIKPQELKSFLDTVRSIEDYWRKASHKNDPFPVMETSGAGLEEGPGGTVVLHPLVKATVEALQKMTPDEVSGLVWCSQANCLDMSVSASNIARALKVMDALLKLLKAKGIEVQVLPRTAGWDYRTCANVFGETVEFKMEEQTHRFYVQQAEGTMGSGEAWVYKPTGQLNLEIKNHRRPGLKSTWVDMRTHPIENQLESFVDGMIWAALDSKNQGKN